MKVIITLAPAAGADLETFSLFKDSDNLPFALNVTRAELEIGQTYVIPDGTLEIRVTPDGACEDSVIEEVVYVVPPEILSVSVQNVTQTNADASGDLVSVGTAPGGVTAKGIVWGESSFPTLDDNLIVYPDTLLGGYSSVVSPLVAGNPYYMRAFATTIQGTFYGVNFPFNSAGAVLPTVSTQAVNPFDQTTGTGHGTIDDAGSQTITERGVVWALTPSPTIADFKSVGTVGSPFTAAMTGLDPNTLYYVKAYATVNVGTAYGNEVQVTTLQVVGVAPTVVTGSIQSVAYDAAVVEGNVLAEGTEPVTEKGIVWATTPAPVIGQGGVTKVPAGSTGAGSYVSNLTGMNPLTVPPTEFFARAYAISSVDTVYGADVSVEYVAVCAPFAGTADEIPVFALPPQVENVVIEAGFTNPNTAISWDASVDIDVFAYILERSTTGPAGVYSEITTQAGISFIDGTTAIGSEYCYRVKAQNLDGVSADWSTQISNCYTPLKDILLRVPAQVDQATACAYGGGTDTYYSDGSGYPPITGDSLWEDNAALSPADNGWYQVGVDSYIQITLGNGLIAAHGTCPIPLNPVTLSGMGGSSSIACADTADTVFYFDGSDTGRPDLGDLIYTSTPANGNAAPDGYYKTSDGGVIRVVTGAVTERGPCLLLVTLGAFGSNASNACATPVPYFSSWSTGTNNLRPEIGDILYTDDGGVSTLSAGYYKTSDDTGFVRTDGAGHVIMSEDCL
jgi:hypothetical protein